MEGEIKYKVMDGNEAAAYIAYKTNEICVIYPITPSSPMGELCDQWSCEGRKNIFDTVPDVIEMQSEAGAAGAIHGALHGGSLTTTFTSSQGLLLMIPNMYKIAGELIPAVFHIAARTVATHALSIFCDHSDVMAVRSTGWAILFGKNPQEAMDMALIAQAATLKSRVPFLNVFDGFRTSHELNKVEIISDNIIKEMINNKNVEEHFFRRLSNENPFIRGTAQNPDVFFQNREASNNYYLKVPELLQETFKKFSSLTKRSYSLFEYYGAAHPDRILIITGSGAGTVSETVNYLNSSCNENVGYIFVRLFRPFVPDEFIRVLPKTVKKIAVLDRSKEPGSIGEPLYMDVINSLHLFSRNNIQVVGGRYGLGSKEFTPSMVKDIFDELKKENPKNNFTVGIIDDVSNQNIALNSELSLDKQIRFRGLFFGLGADGTVSANKNSIKIIGESTPYHVQGYFVYDSKKSGSLTVSHLRFDDKPIQLTYLIDSANFIACHHFDFLNKFDILNLAEKGATFLLNSPYSKEETWDKLPPLIQKEIKSKELKFFIINASLIANETGMGSRINTILQTCFFAVANIITKEEAIKKIKEAIHKTYRNKGEAAIQKNFTAVDKTLDGLTQIDYSSLSVNTSTHHHALSNNASEFVKNVLLKIYNGNGDTLPVSKFPVDGTFPTGTSKWEKRSIANQIPVWDVELCSQCGKCFLICPHAAIRCKVYNKSFLKNVPQSFKYTEPIGKEFNKENEAYTLQVSTEDCTGCNLCVEVCPIENKNSPDKKAIFMDEYLPYKEQEKNNWEFFLKLPEIDRTRVNVSSVKGSQLLQPLFEFSGACAGCGETPYLKLLSQLFGSRMIVANATGCSSIYGGNLPTTPWTFNNHGKGPSWANSLFEDNAEFGLGIFFAIKKKKEIAFGLLKKMNNIIDAELISKIENNLEISETEQHQQQHNIELLKNNLKNLSDKNAQTLLSLTEYLSRKSVWIIGGDGWAYDIGFGGLDHVIASGENVNILVLDTEVYSNTGGQTSKATPKSAIAKFSSFGKYTSKKDLALQAVNYGNVYVAQIAMGANDTHTIKTIIEAENFPGTSLIIAYSHCIAHGYDMKFGAKQQVNAAKSGYWPLFRFNPLKPKGQKFSVDSKELSMPVKEFYMHETRFSALYKNNPENANQLLDSLQTDISKRWDKLQLLKSL